MHNKPTDYENVLNYPLVDLIEKDPSLFQINQRVYTQISIKPLSGIRKATSIWFKVASVNGVTVAHMHSCMHTYTNTHNNQTTNKQTYTTDTYALAYTVHTHMLTYTHITHIHHCAEL